MEREQGERMTQELFLFGIALGIVAILASFITIGFKEKHGEKSDK